MGYRSLVVNKVRKAFDLVKDLAKYATLIQKDTTGYNFATSSPVTSTPISTTIKVVVVDAKKAANDRESETRGAITAEVLLKSEDVVDITVYDKITIDGVTWFINFPHKDDGYLTTLSVYREG